MAVNALFQDILDAHLTPPKWVRELEDSPPLPPIDITDPEYNPYLKGESNVETVRD